MKHSTFYQAKGQKKVYTTAMLTGHHKMLRENYKGRTYKHEDDDCLYFLAPSLPLDKTLHGIEI